MHLMSCESPILVVILKEKIMAKVIAPFKIVGTLNDMTFYEASNQNLVREKGKSGITKKQFKENPIFDKIRQQGTEFGSCSRKSRVFRLLAKQFYDQAKEVSFAGRVNRLLFEILEEDTSQPRGKRTLENGLQHQGSIELLLHFEGNTLRPLKHVLKKKVVFDWKKSKINLSRINVVNDILWPEPEANQVHLQLALANWNYKEDTFEHHYSNEICIEKLDQTTTLSFTIDSLQTQNLWLAYIFIGFSNKERNRTKPLHKKWNTTTIIGVSDVF